MTSFAYCTSPRQNVFPPLLPFPSHQREHYKLDWHRFNLKQRLKNKPVLSALDFEKQSSTGNALYGKTCMGAGGGGGRAAMGCEECVPYLSSGDLSSISGSEDSDSSSEEDLPTLDEGSAEFEKPNRPRGFYPHRVLFKNAQGQFFYAYRCVLGPRQASNSAGGVISLSFYTLCLGFL